MITLVILTNLIEKTYNLILFIINCLIKIINYKLIKMIINTFNLKKVYIDIII